eukprot:30477-Pelagococcus_subviridis.AAC.2
MNAFRASRRDDDNACARRIAPAFASNARFRSSSDVVGSMFETYTVRPQRSTSASDVGSSPGFTGITAVFDRVTLIARPSTTNPSSVSA